MAALNQAQTPNFATPARAPLVVCLDDDHAMLEALAAYLGLHGFSVLTTSEPSVVMECLTTGMASVLVLDCEMPGCSGLELAKTIREMGFRLPLVMYTSHNIPLDERVNLNSVVPKGGNPEALVRALRQELEKVGQHPAVIRA